LHPEDWREPESRKVVGAFHKEGLPEDQRGVDADLERFEEYWAEKGCVNIQGKYHKHGAPYLDDLDGDEARAKAEDARAIMAGEEPRRDPPPRTSRAKEQEPLGKGKVNMATAEILSYAIFRTIFGKELHIPLKKEGMINAEVTIRGKDIIINTDEFYANIPDLKLWRIIYTHQGKTIFQIGRDVPKGMKIFRLNALRLGISLWRQTRAAAKGKAKAEKAQTKEMVVKDS
jgi:hypothetical protein